MLPTDRLGLINALNGLPLVQFNSLVFELKPPDGLMPPPMAPQGDRAFALVNWAESYGGCGLLQLQQVLDQILTHQTQPPSNNRNPTATTTTTATGTTATTEETPDTTPRTEQSILKGANVARDVNIGSINQTVINRQYGSPRPLWPEAAELAAAQQLFEALPLDTPPRPTTLPARSRMPLLRNPLFVGREVELLALARSLKGSAGSTLTAAVSGLGGMGKTQLASEFVHRYGQFFAGGVFWLNFSNKDAIANEVAACGGAAHLDLHPFFAELPIGEQVALVFAAWRGPLPCLLVFDNCEDQQLLADYRPTSGGARVLVTARRARWEASMDVRIVRLGELERIESVALLHMHRPDLDANTGLIEICDELGDLPLALHLAGNFLATYRLAPFGEPFAYLAQLRRREVLEHPSLVGEGAATSPTGHDRHVARTFALSYERLDTHDPVNASARFLLGCGAQLAPGVPIPRAVLSATLPHASDDFAAQLRIENALDRLTSLGLVNEEAEGEIRMHRLVCRFVRTIEGSEAARDAVEVLMLTTFPKTSLNQGTVELQKLEPHLRAVADTAVVRADLVARALCNALGNFLRINTDYTGAKRYLTIALEIAEALLGHGHPDTFIDLNDLGYIHYYLGDHTQARKLLELSLNLEQQAENWPNAAATLDNLAQVAYAEGKSQTAREFYEKALKIRETVLGPEHPDTAITLNNLSTLSFQEGNYAEAISLGERSLQIRMKILPQLNFGVASSLRATGLAMLYTSSTRSEGLNYLQRALTIYEQLLGPTHPRTLVMFGTLVVSWPMKGINSIYLAQFSAKAKEISTLTENSTVLNNIGFFFWRMGNYQEAKRNYEKGLAVEENFPGNSCSIDTVTLNNNLGKLYYSQGDYRSARGFYERSLKCLKAAAGQNVALYAKVLSNLGALLLALEDLVEGREKLEHALALRVELYGEKHKDTASTFDDLGLLTKAEGNFDKAMNLIQLGLTIRKEVLGDLHLDVAKSLHSLGVLLNDQGKSAQACECLEDALSILKCELPPDHPDISSTLYSLGKAWVVQRETARAKELFERALAIWQMRREESHPMAQAILGDLLSLRQPIEGE
jgi:tetratricopeptide (TPR) repeat protein